MDEYTQVSPYSPPMIEYASVGKMYEVAGWICKFARFGDLELGDRFFLARSKDGDDWPFIGTSRTVFEKIKPLTIIKSMDFVANAQSLRGGIHGRHLDDDLVLHIQGPYTGEVKDANNRKGS
jgi:hypothetical protein